MVMQSPLARARGLGSAKSGTRQWWFERVTAIALLPLSLWLVASLIGLVGADHAVIVAWIRDPLVAVPLLLFAAIMFWHLQMGVKVVIEDYIHHEGVKIGALLLVNFAVVVLAAAAVFSILKIALGV